MCLTNAHESTNEVNSRSLVRSYHTGTNSCHLHRLRSRILSYLASVIDHFIVHIRNEFLGKRTRLNNKEYFAASSHGMKNKKVPLRERHSRIHLINSVWLEFWHFGFVHARKLRLRKSSSLHRIDGTMDRWQKSKGEEEEEEKMPKKNDE